MKIKIDRNQPQEVDRLRVIIGEKEFVIKQNNFGELIINKCSFGEESETITIRPKVSNEIGLK